MPLGSWYDLPQWLSVPSQTIQPCQHWKETLNDDDICRVIQFFNLLLASVIEVCHYKSQKPYIASHLTVFVILFLYKVQYLEIRLQHLILWFSRSLASTRSIHIKWLDPFWYSCLHQFVSHLYYHNLSCMQHFIPYMSSLPAHY